MGSSLNHRWAAVGTGNTRSCDLIKITWCKCRAALKMFKLLWPSLRSGGLNTRPNIWVTCHLLQRISSLCQAAVKTWGCRLLWVRGETWMNSFECFNPQSEASVSLSQVSEKFWRQTEDVSVTALLIHVGNSSLWSTGWQLKSFRLFTPQLGEK